MRTLALAALLLFSSKHVATAQWERVNDPSLLFSIHDVDFADDRLGFAVGRTIVLKTEDGGRSWSLADSSSFKNPITLEGVTSESTPLGIVSFVYGAPLFVARSTDAGSTWTTTQSGLAAHFRDVCFRPDGSLIAFGEGGWVAESQDQGISWDPRLIFPTADMNTAQCLPDGSLWAAGFISDSGFLRATVINSTDGGESWHSSFISPTQVRRTMVDIEFLSDSVAYAVSHDLTFRADRSNLWKTEDAGNSWLQVLDMPRMHAIEFFDDKTGLMVGEGGIIFSTFDGGNSWSSDTTASLGFIRDVTFLSDGTAIIVGDNGVHRFEGFVATASETAELPLPRSASVAFPNPAHTSVTIQLGQGKSGVRLTTISIIDVLGRVVEEIPLQDQNRITVSVQDLPSGFYLYRSDRPDGPSGSFTVR